MRAFWGGKFSEGRRRHLFFICTFYTPLDDLHILWNQWKLANFCHLFLIQSNKISIIILFIQFCLLLDYFYALFPRCLRAYGDKFDWMMKYVTRGSIPRNSSPKSTCWLKSTKSRYANCSCHFWIISKPKRQGGMPKHLIKKRKSDFSLSSPDACQKAGKVTCALTETRHRLPNSRMQGSVSMSRSRSISFHSIGPAESEFSSALVTAPVKVSRAVRAWWKERTRSVIDSDRVKDQKSLFWAALAECASSSSGADPWKSGVRSSSLSANCVIRARAAERQVAARFVLLFNCGGWERSWFSIKAKRDVTGLRANQRGENSHTARGGAYFPPHRQRWDFLTHQADSVLTPPQLAPKTFYEIFFDILDSLSFGFHLTLVFWKDWMIFVTLKWVSNVLISLVILVFFIQSIQNPRIF